MNLSIKELKTLEWRTVAEKQLVSDLLEAHELIGEMRDLLNFMATNTNGAYTLAKLTEMMDKSKDYV